MVNLFEILLFLLELDFLFISSPLIYTVCGRKKDIEAVCLCYVLYIHIFICLSIYLRTY